MKIFISSTYEDLKDYRTAVRDAILRLGHQPVEMEDFGSEPDKWKTAVLGKLDGCAALVGIYAHRYGSIPPGDETSITEQEFDKAQELDVPCFCYVVDPDLPWLPKYIDHGAAQKKLKRFLKKPDALLRSTFKSPEHLAGRVAADLGSKLQQKPAQPLIAHHTLRAPDQYFTGRDAEIQQLKQMLRAGGPVAITGIRGMGGIGKTELALFVANELRGDYPDAQLLIEMRGTSDAPHAPADALADIIRAFVGLDAKLPDDPSELALLYRDQLNDKRALIVLDDLADESQIPFFQPPAGTALLITSRQALPVPSLSLDELPSGDARDLLREMAPRVPAPVADEICRLCGFLPLAIHAAGGLLSVASDLPPEQYAAQLSDERQRLPKLGRVSVPITVEASFSLSYRQLDANATLVFRQLAVFLAPFDAEAETYVAQDPDHTRLTDLVRRSLAQYDAAAERYRLHDLARLFADARLTPDERYAAQLRHAQHYLQVAYAAGDLYLKGGDNILPGLALFDGAFPHIRAGQAWAASLAATDDDAAHLCNKFPDAAIHNIALRLHGRDLIKWFESALAAARKLGDKHAEGNHLGNLGVAYDNLGEVRKAIDYHEQALAVAREIGDRRGEAADLGNLGNAHLNLGEVRKAIEYHEQAMGIQREIGDRRGEAADLGSLGNAHLNLGEVRKAIDYYEQALAIQREIGDRRGEGSALGNLGNAYKDLGEVRKAIDYYEQALAIDRGIGDRRGEGNALGNLGNAYKDLGEVRKAIDCYEQALAIAREIGDRRGEGNRLGNLGLAYYSLGEVRKAIEYYEQALAIDREIGDRRGEGNRLGNLGLAYYSLGEVRKAIEYYEQALAIAREIGDRQGEAADLGNLGNAHEKLGDLPSAITYAESALRIFEAIQSPYAQRARQLVERLRQESTSS